MAQISTIIPVFNRQTSAERALRSALEQDVADQEIVIVDDSSQPPFQVPVALAKENVRVIRHPDNRGAAAARNTGVEAAQGSWIAFLDSDDYWLPQTLLPRLAMAERVHAITPSALAAYAAGFMLYNELSGRRETRIPRPSDNPLHFASGCWFSPGSTMLLRKEVFQQVGHFDPLLRRLEDLDWFLRFALAGGRLESWPDTAAMVELGGKPDLAVLENAARYLQAKYADRNSPYHLPPPYIRRLKAYLDIERASIHAAQRRWAPTIYYITRSLLRAPRTTLHLERFWETA